MRTLTPSQKNASPEEKHKWLNKQGTDWSGAFGDDPANYMDSDGRKRAEPGRAPRAPHDPNNPSSDEDSGTNTDATNDTDDDLGIQDAEHGMNGSRASFQSGKTRGTMESGWTAGTTDSFGERPKTDKEIAKGNKRTEERKQRGLMQWKPARNLKFAKDQGIIGIRKLKGRVTGGLEGREPGVETETGS